jgi:aminopeptidase N
MLRKERGARRAGWRTARRRARSRVLINVLFLSFLPFIASRRSASLQVLDIDRHERLIEHEEARAKRARFAADAIARASLGVLPPSVEGRDRGVDVLSYDLWFGLDPAAAYLQGRTTIRLEGVALSTPSLGLDFDDSFAITSLQRDGRTLSPVSRGGSKLVVPFDPPLQSEERTTLTVSYEGVTPPFCALSFFTHDTGAAATSIAEPFGARTFWPCVDDPNDKAVVTVHATVPAGYAVASAGLVTAADEPDGRKTFTWTLPQPISTYLVSLNASNYQTIEDTYTAADGRTMPIRSYVFPEHVATNADRLKAIKSHIATQASMFGEYPFLDTKYGIVASSFSGGMEHPTMTSIGANLLGNGGRDLTLLLVHELTHQWWGDRVTMRTWDDIWLNEGFATYGEVLYSEKALGRAPGNMLTTQYDDGLYGGRLAQPVVAPASDPFRYTGSVYNKGARALHMLRRLVGDDVFFPALRAYGDAHALGTASRGELRRMFEDRSGLDLKAFFDQWIETPYRPILRATYQNAVDAASVTIVVTQTQTHAVVHPEPDPSDEPWYRFPLTIRLLYPDGTFVDRTIEVDGQTTRVVLPNEARKPVIFMTLDPASDLLKIVESVGAA